jgi:SAM-dependent methyltransferase
MLPQGAGGRVLDVGCGPGSQTLELARLCPGEITAVDTHQPYLDRLRQRAADAGFGHRITTLNRSMLGMGFGDRVFDLVWAEGSIYIIGLEQGLREWRELLVDGGHVVFTELVWLRAEPPSEVAEFFRQGYPDMRHVDDVVALVGACGYDLVGHFTLPGEAWWRDYYGPLEKRLDRLVLKYAGDAEVLDMLELERTEIDMYRRYHDGYGYEFVVARKGDNESR